LIEQVAKGCADLSIVAVTKVAFKFRGGGNDARKVRRTLKATRRDASDGIEETGPSKRAFGERVQRSKCACPRGDRARH
jgi:hypothetical protein